MHRILPVILIVLLLLTACGKTVTDESADAETEIAQTQTTENETTTAETETAPQPQAETAPPETEASFPVRTLPGHIASDVYVRLWDGDLAPGLRAGDAETVKQIIRAQSWGMSYDNLSDVRIDAEGVPYAYDTQSGILTEADDRAAKLDESERVQLNAILADYLDGYDEERGFFAP